jgi:hypothetical protein
VAESKPLNGIAANWFHGEGAIAQCFYCRRYSLDPKTLGEDRYQPVCECGKKHGWSGSFRKPGPNAKWSGKAHAGVAMGDCGNAECNWRGPISECSYIGTVGPCCPQCREIVEPDAPGVIGLGGAKQHE